jgi:ketosteroid isomerase-like protein
MREQHPNLGLVRRLWEAGARGDADGISEIYAPDAVLRAHGIPGGPLVGEFKGISEILDFLARMGELVDDSRAEVLEMYASDTGVVVRFRSVKSRGGKHLDMQYLYVLAIEHGRIVRATLVPTDQRRGRVLAIAVAAPGGSSPQPDRI